jgi:hypothetical protein
LLSDHFDCAPELGNYLQKQWSVVSDQWSVRQGRGSSSPRSPKARDRGHPQFLVMGPGPPAARSLDLRHKAARRRESRTPARAAHRLAPRLDNAISMRLQNTPSGGRREFIKRVYPHPYFVNKFLVFFSLQASLLCKILITMKLFAKYSRISSYVLIRPLLSALG